jgi:hypothetical protein
MNSPKCTSCQTYYDAKAFVEDYNRGIISKKDMDIDLAHLSEDHIRVYCQYMLAIRDIENKALKEKIRILEKENAALKAKQPTPTKIQQRPEVVADPGNYAVGFCIAIFPNPDGTIAKCCEKARYKSDLCSAHSAAKSVIEVESKAKKNTPAKAEKSADAK